MSIKVSGRDLKQWIQHCFVTVDKSGALFYVSTCGGDGAESKVKGHLYPPNDGTPAIKGLKNTDVSLWWPQIGCINYTDIQTGIRVGLYLFRRHGGRQWKRSYHPELIGVEIPREWDITQEVGNPLHIRMDDIGVVSQLKDGWYPKNARAATAFLTTSDKHISVAINLNTILYYDGIAKSFVYYKGDYVADLDHDTLHLECYKGGTIEKRLKTSLGI